MSRPEHQDPAAGPTVTVTDGGGNGRDDGAALPVFLPGEVLADRFEVVRCIGQGGMGQVFEAEDRELGTRVALKVIRPDRTARRRSLERLKREVHLARRVTHVNACRIFDLFIHRGEEDSRWGKNRPPIFFLTMERVKGETLSERLRRQGPLAPEEALPLVRQMAAGLDAIHGAGLVHRDFKSANVMLEPRPGGESRAVVADFGLAKAGGSLRKGDAAGTPAYAAPEQLAGGAVTPVADVYSLGLVLHEMLTGTLPPHEGEDGGRALAEAALPGAWRRVIQRCLEPRPERRYASAGEVVAALEGGSRRLRRPRRIAAGLAAGVALLAGSGWISVTDRWPWQAPAAAEAPPRVGVLDLDNRAGAEAAWVGTALTESLRAHLAGGGRVHTVEAQEVARMQRALALNGRTAAAMRRAAGYLQADFAIEGSFEIAEQGTRVRLVVWDAAGREVSRWEGTADDDALDDLARRAAAEIVQALGVGQASAGGRTRGPPGDPKAAQLYARGLERLHAGDPAGSLPLLTEAAERDAGAAWTFGALTEAWMELGNDRESEVAAQRAFELAADMSREEQLSYEARYREATKDWAAAARLYGALATVHPDRLGYALSLARVQTAGGRPLQALETLESWRAARGSDPRIHLAVAGAARARADYDLQLSAARSAVEGALRLDAPPLTARARLHEAEALDGLGRPEEAAVAQRAAVAYYEESGDRRGLAQALLARQDHQAARDPGDFGISLDEALEAFREAGDLGGEARALAKKARSSLLHLEAERDWEAVRPEIEEALEAARAAGSRLAEAEALNALAIYLYTGEEVERSLPVFARAVEAARASGNLRMLAGVLGNHARILATLGRRGEARAEWEEVLEITRDNGSRYVHALNLHSFGHQLVAAGDLAAADAAREELLNLAETLEAKNLEALERGLAARIQRLRGDVEAGLAAKRKQLDLWRETGAGRVTIQRDELGLADSLVRLGRWVEAERLLDSLDLALPPDDLSYDAKWAALLRARLSLDRGDPETAASLLERLAPTLRGEEAQLVRRHRGLEAEVVAARGGIREAIDALRGLVAEVEASDTTLAERLDARLLLGRTLVEAGRTEEGRQVLGGLLRQAEATGFRVYVPLAERALAGGRDAG